MSFKIFICLLVSFISAITNPLSAMVIGIVPEAKSEAELLNMTDYFSEVPIADEIVVVDPWAFSTDERAVMICLQGLVARTEASILLKYHNEDADELTTAGYTLLYKDENGNDWTLKSLINRYSSHIKDSGYVLYKDSATTEQINMAFNMASVFGYLAVPSSCEGTVKACSLEKKEDLSTQKIDFAYQLDFYDKYNEIFHDNALVHNVSSCDGLRDFAVREKIFITYSKDDDILGKSFRKHILRNLDPCSVVLGWCQYERSFTEEISAFGHYIIPSDFNRNMSILNSLPDVEIANAGEINIPELDPNKHYAAIVISDGDNAQWIANNFNIFYDWQRLENDTPISFTFAPLMNEFSPTAVRMINESKGENVSFITGPTGVGYARISEMSASELEAFSDATASAMLKSGLKTMTLLDEPDTVEKLYIENKLEYFARYDNIQGGVFQLDPTRYEGGKGKVYFVNDKPFITVRKSLWHPSGSYEEVTKEWIKEQAETVNNYPADINSINGYSVINVHVWSITAENLAYFISCLDEDVEIISADELVSAVKANVPHKTAVPN